MIKKYVTLSLFIFWAVIVAVLVAGLVFYDRNKTTNNLQQTTNNLQPITNSAQEKIFTTQEIAKHNTLGDCWLLINGNVYDVTSYINKHPGTPATIAPYCGKEATQAFDTKGGEGKPHSGKANNMLGDYLIGKVGK